MKTIALKRGEKTAIALKFLDQYPDLKTRQVSEKINEWAQNKGYPCVWTPGFVSMIKSTKKRGRVKGRIANSPETVQPADALFESLLELLVDLEKFEDLDVLVDFMQKYRVEWVIKAREVKERLNRKHRLAA